jgi:hypothetical protein
LLNKYDYTAGTGWTQFVVLVRIEPHLKEFAVLQEN